MVSVTLKQKQPSTQSNTGTCTNAKQRSHESTPFMYHKSLTKMEAERAKADPELVLYHQNASKRAFKRISLPEPMAEQIADARMMVELKRLCLYNEAGTGKTLTTTLAIEEIFDLDQRARILVAAPKNAIYQWVETLGSFFDNIEILLITQGAFHRDPKVRPHVIVVPYSVISRSPALAGKLRAWKPTVVVMDECDGYGLGELQSAITTKLLGPNAERQHGVIEFAKYMWPLSGTPTRRYYDNMFPILKALYPDILEEYDLHRHYKFVAQFCATERRKFRNSRLVQIVTGFRNEEYMRALLYHQERPLAIRRYLRDVAKNLPPVSFQDVHVDYVVTNELIELTEKALEYHYDHVLEARELNHYVNQAAHAMGLAKVPEVVEFLERAHTDTSGGVLVLFWYRDVGHSIADMLKERGHTVAVFDGETKEPDRIRIKAQFNERKINFLIGQIAAMGVALNLQAGGNVVVFAERPWSSAQMEQALRRIWRLGQQHHVQVYVCKSEHPIEAMFDATLAKKAGAQEGLR